MVLHCTLPVCYLICTFNSVLTPVTAEIVSIQLCVSLCAAILLLQIIAVCVGVQGRDEVAVNVMPGCGVVWCGVVWWGCSCRMWLPARVF